MFPDAEQYDKVAANVLDGKGLVLREERKAQRPPLYPLFMILCGRNLLTIRVAQALIGAASCVLLYAFCRMLFASEPVAKLAAAGLAIEPFSVFFTGLALTETLYLAVLLAVMVSLARMIRDSLMSRAASAGVLLGVSILLKPAVLLLPFFLAPFLLVLVRPVRRAAGLWALMTVCVALTMSPWILRNYEVLGAFIPTTTQGGESLWEANNPEADGGPMMDRGIFPEDLDSLPEVERDRALSLAARRFIAENPGRFAVLCCKRLVRFWNVLLNFSEYRRPVYNAISLLSTVPIYVLGLLGLVYAWRERWQMALLCLVPILYTSGLHLVFVGSVRYRVPIVPYLLCFAAFGLSRLLRVDGEPDQTPG